MSYADTYTELRRLNLLRILLNTKSCTENHLVLRSALAAISRKESLTVIEQDLRQFAAAGCITLEEITQEGLPRMLKATLTPFGADVAEGLEKIPGVRAAVPGV